MVSIIKNQLLKHLSRFTKNLSADKINLSTFKGEGELTNLELNEIVLTDLLELPSWLRLTSAWCNKVSFRVQWTKLKSVPIHLSLDEVKIIVETCEELRPMSAQTGLSSLAAVPGKYSFIHKVIDGITITVNTVNITFNSPAFTASVQVSRIIVESKNPRWDRSDLRMTRLKESGKGQLLIFKELVWQTVRIEAQSTKDKNLTPLRLLTNQARCRIIIKKRLSDCFVMGSRLVVILDDLLWVLTDSQLKAALHFLDSLAGLVEKATLLSRQTKAARKLEELPEYQAQLAQQARATEGVSPISKLFSRCDVVETSYHFVSQHISLHLCDDPGEGRSCHPNLKDGGALQISVQRFQVDYYPYHLAKGDRKHWPRYQDTSLPHSQWLEQALSTFRTRFVDLVDRNKSQHAPLSRASKANMQESTDGSPSPTLEQKKVQSPNQIKNYVLSQFAKLMTMCVIIRVEDFTVYRVTTSGKKKPLKEFIAGDRYHISLPEDSNIIHAEFVYFYYPHDYPFPLPPPKFYVHVNPIQVCFDLDSCLWFNSFALNLHQSLLDMKQDMSGSNITYIDIKIEAILPRLIFESNVDYQNQRDRPKTLNFQVTRATITNVRSLEQSSRADLAKCVDSFHMGSLFFGSEFPSHPNDFYIVTEKFLDHISATDNIRMLPAELNTTSINAMMEQLSREMLWTEAKDVWCINLDPVWGDFLGARAVGNNKAVPFLDAVPVTVWLHANMDPNSTVKANTNGPRNADIHALAHISNLVSVQINHYQYLFLLRLSEDVGELATFLSIDSNRILKIENSGSIAIGALIPQLEVTFVMPSQCPGKESSGGDVESFVPDSSSYILCAAEGYNTSVSSINQFDTSKENVENGIQFEMAMPTVTSCSMDFVPYIDNKTSKNQTQPFPSINLPNNFNAGISSVKKGFSSLMTSIDTALKPSPDDASDTVSIRSDASSDSENYVVINLGADGDRTTEEGMFRVNSDVKTWIDNKPVEVASEVIEEDSVTTTSNHSLTSSCKRRDLVSVSTFKLNKVEFLQQSAGYSSNIKVQVGNISNEDCGSIPWDEFQTKFSSRSRAWSDNLSNNSTSARVKLRLDHNLKLPSSRSLSQMDLNDRESLKKLFTDLLHINVSNLNLDMSMSTVTGLADLAEDEIICVPMPMEIFLENVQLHLIEDRPPVNITSPGPVPINLDVSHLFITRGEDNVFRIVLSKNSGLVKYSSSTSVQDEQETINALIQQTCKQLKMDNEELKRRLLAFERVSEENRALRRSKEETDILRSCLTSAQDDVARLLEEKRKLLEDVGVLRHQLEDRGRQWSSKR